MIGEGEEESAGALGRALREPVAPKAEHDGEPESAPAPGATLVPHRCAMPTGAEIAELRTYVERAAGEWMNDGVVTAPSWRGISLAATCAADSALTGTLLALLDALDAARAEGRAEGRREAARACMAAIEETRNAIGRVATLAQAKVGNGLLDIAAEHIARKFDGDR